MPLASPLKQGIESEERMLLINLNITGTIDSHTIDLTVKGSLGDVVKAATEAISKATTPPKPTQKPTPKQQATPKAATKAAPKVEIKKICTWAKELGVNTKDLATQLGMHHFKTVTRTVAETAIECLADQATAESKLQPTPKPKTMPQPTKEAKPKPAPKPKIDISPIKNVPDIAMPVAAWADALGIPPKTLCETCGNCNSTYTVSKNRLLSWIEAGSYKDKDKDKAAPKATVKPKAAKKPKIKSKTPLKAAKEAVSLEDKLFKAVKTDFNSVVEVVKAHKDSPWQLLEAVLAVQDVDVAWSKWQLQTLTNLEASLIKQIDKEEAAA